MKSSTRELEREYPWASVITGTYKPSKFGYQFGLGAEFESNESFFLIRTGIEYGIELPQDWEFTAEIVADFKINAYDSYAIAFGIVKHFK